MAVAEGARGGAYEFEQEASRRRAVSVPWLDIVICCAIFVPLLSVYILTLSPGLSYNSLDGNELATVPYILGLAHSTGYPLYTWLGKSFTYIPIGDVAYRMNLMSAFGAAIGALCLYGIVRLTIASSTRLNGEAGAKGQRAVAIGAAVLGALLFGLSTTLWSQAVITEVYAPNAAMLGLTVLLLLVWSRYESRRKDLDHTDAGSLGRFGAFALAFGLSIGTHMSNLALAPAFVLFILLTNWRVVKQPQFLALGLLGFGIGVLQFAWLPIKAHDLNDPTVRNSPSDLNGIYNYTLNAFPQFKFAYPLEALPNRLVLYLKYLLENFHIGGVLLGVVGVTGMSVLNPKAFFLFMTAYAIEVAFFIDYGVADLDVFFISAHLLFAVFTAYGAWYILSLLVGWATQSRADFGTSQELLRPHPDPLQQGLGSFGVWRKPALVVLVAILIALQPGISLARNWSENDQTANTGIEDFYKLAFAAMPSNSTLSGQRGVFGYDAFYFRLVYGVRPDISMPGVTPAASRSAPTTAGQNVFTTGGFGRGPGGGGLPGGFGAQTASGWTWPLLASPTVREDGGSTRQLTLYQTRSQAPQLFVRNASPQHAVNAGFGNLTLVGYDLDAASVQAGDAVGLKLYWRVNGNSSPTVATKIGDTSYIETHPLGFGMLQRYIQVQGQPASGSLLVEDYRLVVLSSLDAGEQPVRVRAGDGDWVEIGRIAVTK